MFSTFKFSGLPKGDPPGAPTSFAMVRGGTYTPSFFWNAPVSNGNRPITGYIVNLDGVGSRSVGFPTFNGYAGRTYYYEWSTDCATCNYTGSVQAVNSIGTGSAAGGGQACANPGQLISSGNCSGYTRYDTYTDGSCGSYNTATEYNSVSCGYNPCAGCTPNGTFLYSTCDSDDYRRYSVYANGCCGVYQITEYNVPECGYNPCAGCPGRRSYTISSGCNSCAGGGGCDVEYVFPDGCCGTYSECSPYDCCSS